MNLPIQASPVMRSTGNTTVSAGVQSSDFVSCMLSCLGSAASQCLHCGTSVSCWIGCAGPKAASCAIKCAF